MLITGFGFEVELCNSASSREQDTVAHHSSSASAGLWASAASEGRLVLGPASAAVSAPGSALLAGPVAGGSGRMSLLALLPSLSEPAQSPGAAAAFSLPARPPERRSPAFLLTGTRASLQRGSASQHSILDEVFLQFCASRPSAAPGSAGFGFTQTWFTTISKIIQLACPEAGS